MVQCVEIHEQEMESRGVKVIRYADDIVVLAKSKRAAMRILKTGQWCLGKKDKSPDEHTEKQGG